MLKDPTTNTLLLCHFPSERTKQTYPLRDILKATRSKIENKNHPFREPRLPATPAKSFEYGLGHLTLSGMIRISMFCSASNTDLSVRDWYRILSSASLELEMSSRRKIWFYFFEGKGDGEAERKGAGGFVGGEKTHVPPSLRM